MSRQGLLILVREISLCGVFFKDNVYITAPKTIQDLKKWITGKIVAIGEKMPQRAIQNDAKFLCMSACLRDGVS